MKSLNVLMIDCGVWELTQTLYSECDLSERSVLQVQRILAAAIAQAMTDNGKSVVEDFTPRI